MTTAADATTATDAAVLSVRGVQKTYQLGGGLVDRLLRRRDDHGTLTALDGVDLELRRGEVLALVGESGSGKSTLAKILVSSEQPTSGEVLIDGHPVPAHRGRADKRRIQMVFQDPYSSLNPRKTVGQTLGELLRLHDIVPRSQVRAECLRLLALVGMDAEALPAYPSQFSGGQRQRIAIARALAVRPEILIADEPVSALDVSVQATILELFGQLRDELGLSVLFVAHNLAVVQHLSQRVAVMYLGRIVEQAPTAEIFLNPRHPYTRALISSIPRMTPGTVNSRFQVTSEPPSPFNIPSGCRFHTRCPVAIDRCRTTDPALEPVGQVTSSATGNAGRPADDAHLSACLLADSLAPPDRASRIGGEL